MLGDVKFQRPHLIRVIKTMAIPISFSVRGLLNWLGSTAEERMRAMDANIVCSLVRYVSPYSKPTTIGLTSFHILTKGPANNSFGRSNRCGKPTLV